MTHPLIDRLKTEHQLIEELINQAKSENDHKRQKILLKQLYHINETQHHFNEETLLFAKTSEKEKIREGGPFCVLYYDQHISNPPIEKVEKLIHKKIQIKSTQQNFYDRRSPICIPIDEHRAGEALLNFIILEHDHLSISEIDSLLYEYQNIQKQHFKKEEGCFFCLVNNLLTVAELDEILALWPPLVVDDNGVNHAQSDEPN